MSGPKFDTGLARAQRTLLRSAVATALSDLLSTNGGYLRAIRSLPRPLRGHDLDELGFIGNAIQGQAPCVLIALGAKKYEPVDMDSIYRGRVEVALYVCSNNLRGRIDGRIETDVAAAADATKDPGIDAILENVEERLLGTSFHLGSQTTAAAVTSQMFPESEDEVFTGDDMTVWEQRYSVELYREPNPNRAITAVVTSVETDTEIEGADPANPIVTTVANLEAP